MTPAIRALKAQKINHTLYSYECDVDHDFGHYSAHELGRDENEVYKTLVFHSDKTYVTAVIPVNRTLNLKQAARLAGLKKAEMAKPEDAMRITGYVVGGISPFGQKKRLLTLLDQEAMAHEEILVSGGKRGLSVGVKPQDLVDFLSARVGAITDEK
ncbi:MAG: Cys-tRNA(Pro) deacylase [Succinivibrionaceae bacterium]|nr:Cys-tRNA(Pro) deacylase [Succinivibrionaceae bacterium]